LTDPITVNIGVGWGQDYNGTYPVTAVAIGGPLPGIDLSYAELRTDLQAAYLKSGSAADAVALANLSSDPWNGGQIYVSPAQEKAWGLLPTDGSGLDGAIGFSSQYAFSYTPTNRANNGQIDLIGVAEHELTHALGRSAGYPTGNVNNGQYTALDLFRYSA
jgi:hypothetical protein